MAEYIDREMATEIIDNYAKTISKDCLVVYQAIRDIVDTICPAVEAKPVVHAHWEYTGESDGKKIYRCTNCQALLSGTGNFCKECGAQMDEVTLDE